MKQVILTIFFGEIINSKENEEYIETTVTYEVLEKIGTEEKIQFQEVPKRKELIWKREV